MTGDLPRLRNLRATLDEMLRPGFGEGDEAAIAEARSEIADIEAAWPDDRLVRSSRDSGDLAGDVERDALATEMQRRGLAPPRSTDR